MKWTPLYMLLLSGSCCGTVFYSCGSHPRPSSKPTRKDTLSGRDTVIPGANTPAKDSLVARDSPAVRNTSPIQEDTTPAVKQLSRADLKNARIIPDTTISYGIDEEELSLEGNEAKVHYLDNVWTEANWVIFAETGRDEIRYWPVGDSRVKVEEKEYHYRHDLSDANLPGNTRLEHHLLYLIDLNGDIISISRGKKEDIRDVFIYFKKYVPFIIR